MGWIYFTIVLPFIGEGFAVVYIWQVFLALQIILFGNAGTVCNGHGNQVNHKVNTVSVVHLLF